MVALNVDEDGIATSAEYGNTGAGVSKWYHWHRIADGGNTALGATTDAAVVTGNGSLIAWLKGLVGLFVAEDSAVADGQRGIPVLLKRNDNVAAQTTADGDATFQSVDSSGVAFVATVPPLAAALAVRALSEAGTGAAAASLVIKASAGTLFRMDVTNTNASAQYIQLFNSTTLPADATVPTVTLHVPAQSHKQFTFGEYGRRFATGIVVCNSSTPFAKTIGAADCTFSAGYI